MSIIRCNDVKLIYSINESTYDHLYVDSTNTLDYKNQLVGKLYEMLASLGIDYNKEKTLITGYVTKSILNDALILVNNQGTQEFLNNQILFELANPVNLQIAFESYINSKETKSGEVEIVDSFKNEKDETVTSDFTPTVLNSVSLADSFNVEELNTDIDTTQIDTNFAEVYWSKDNDVYINLRNFFKAELFGKLIFDSTDVNKPFKDISDVKTVTDIVNSYKNQLRPTNLQVQPLFDELVKFLQSGKKLSKAYLATLEPSGKLLYSQALAYVHFDNLSKVFLEGILKKEGDNYAVSFASNLYNQMIRDDEKTDAHSELPPMFKLLVGTIQKDNGDYMTDQDAMFAWQFVQQHPDFTMDEVSEAEIYTKYEKILNDLTSNETSSNTEINAIKSTASKYLPILNSLKNFLYGAKEQSFISLRDAGINAINNGTIRHTVFNQSQYLNMLINSLNTAAELRYMSIEMRGEEMRVMIGMNKDNVGLRLANHYKSQPKSTSFTNKVTKDSDDKEIRTIVFDIGNGKTVTFEIKDNQVIISSTSNLSSTQYVKTVFTKMGLSFDDSTVEMLLRDNAKTDTLVNQKFAFFLNNLFDVSEVSGIIKPNTPAEYNALFNNASMLQNVIQSNELEVEQAQQTSVKISAMGEAVPRITLYNYLLGFKSKLNRLRKYIDNNVSVLSLNPYVQNLLKPTMYVLDGVKNGIDAMSFKQLSENNKFLYGFGYMYWKNRADNNKVGFLPMEYSDKSRNLAIMFDKEAFNGDMKVTLDTMQNDRVFNEYFKSQRSYLNNMKSIILGRYDKIAKQFNPDISITTIDDLTKFLEGKTEKELVKAAHLAGVELVNELMYVVKDGKVTFKQMIIDEFKSVEGEDDVAKQNFLNYHKKKIQDMSQGMFNAGINELNASITKAIVGDTKNPVSELFDNNKLFQTNNGTVTGISPALIRYYIDHNYASENLVNVTQGNVFQYKGGSLADAWINSTKRNVFPLATGIRPLLGLSNGLEYDSIVAVVKDETFKLFNMLGDVHKQDIEDGSIFLLEHQIIKFKNSVQQQVGNDIGIVLKDINYGFDNELGVAKLNKDAAHPLTSEKIRKSKSTQSLVEKMMGNRKYAMGTTVNIPAHSYAIEKLVNGKIEYEVVNVPQQVDKPVNSLLDIHKLMGNQELGKNVLGSDIVVEDKNGAIKANGKSYRYAKTEDAGSAASMVVNTIEVENPSIKGQYLGEIHLVSSRKSGVVNVNDADTFTNDVDFIPTEMTNVDRLIQLNARHKVDDHSKLTLPGQFVNASLFNQFTQTSADNANTIVKAMSKMIQQTIEDELKFDKKGNFNPTELQKVIVRLITDKPNPADFMTLKSEILANYKNADDFPFEPLLTSVSAKLNSFLSEAIKQKIDGTQAVMGINKTEVYRLNKPVYQKSETEYQWARTSTNSYEVSSQGDKRFSALIAKLNDGRTIEEAYQLDIKGYRSQGDDWKLGKGKPPIRNITKEQQWNEYKNLWKQYLNENSQLKEELKELAKGKVLTDKFANTDISQARALAEILNEGEYIESNEEVLMTYDRIKLLLGQTINGVVVDENWINSKKDRVRGQEWILNTSDGQQINLYNSKEVVVMNLIKQLEGSLEKEQKEKVPNTVKITQLNSELAKYYAITKQMVESNGFEYQQGNELKQLEGLLQLKLNKLDENRLKENPLPVAFEMYNFQSNDDLRKVFIGEIPFDFNSATTRYEVTSYNSKPAEMIAPYKWFKEFGIEIGTNLADIDFEFFAKQIANLPNDELIKLHQKYFNNGETDIDTMYDDIVNLKYENFEESLKTIVGRIN